MNVRVEQGRKVDICVADFEGAAGLQEYGRAVTLAYRPNKRGRVLPGTTIQVDGEAWKVIASGLSDFAKGVRLLTLEKVEANG